MKKALALVLSLVMLLGVCGTAFAYHTTDEVTELEQYNSDLSTYLATQGYALLENNGLLPLPAEGKIALYGNGVAYTVKGGTGSGAVNNRNNQYGVNGDNIADAFIDAGWEVTNPEYVDSVRMVYNSRTGTWARATGVQAAQAVSDEQIEEGLAADTAIYIISRNAGEFSDRVRTNATSGYELTPTERANVEKVAAAYDKFIVVYNTCVMDAAWQDEVDNIDAVVYMNNGGQRGSEALVKLLTGGANFSGKITDTWPKSYLDYPSTAGFANNDGNTMTEYYTEGIYVGYRYFDTFGLDVCYPFGYGLSYTEFEINTIDVAVEDDEVVLQVRVANSGAKYSGKEVVQVYFSAPDGELEKPYQELAAYGKTDELAPGDAQVLTLRFDLTDMSSYSMEKAAYIMEAGDYIIRVGNSSRNTEAVAKITLDETAITEQLSNQRVKEENAVLEELSKEGATPIANNDAAELADAIVINLTADDIPFVNNASPYDDETITTYLFADDAENYHARESITLQTKTVAGIINNAQNPDGPRFNGYSTTTYAEVVEIVPDLPEGITKETAKLTDVYEGKITMDQFLACLSSDECARLAVGGAGTMEEPAEGEPYVGAQADSVRGGAGQTTQAYYKTRFIPAMPNADGPAGIRITQSYNLNGQTVYQFCTAFPAGTCMAMTWDKDAIFAEGVAVGSEMAEYGVTTWLAPGINIHRNPLCGRNFEYYSEDPYVTGMTAAHVTAGVQSNPGVGVTLKHFFGNSQETNRNQENNVMSERTAREIYLKGFEIAVKLAQPMCIMNSYNCNNGWPASDDYDLNEDITRGEWGFKGAIMTDWGGGQSTPLISMHGGCDMIMSGGDSRLRQVRQAVGVVEPTFNDDGSIRNRGSFEPITGGSVIFVVPSDVESEEFLPEVVATAVANEQARYDKYGDDATITWYGEYTAVNRLCLGDVQKSARRVLENALVSRDMVNLYADLLDKEIVAPSISEEREAPLATGYDPDAKSDIVNVGIIAETITVDTVADKTAAVEVSYIGDEPITTARLTLESALPIKDIESDFDFEYNEDTNEIIVYDGAGEVIDGVLFTINYEFDAVIPDGEYPIDLGYIEVTDADSAVMYAVAIDGAIIVDNNYPIGDVTQDGEVDNRDLILIARYLVHLVEFNAKQKIAADFNEDGIINNTDLVLIARAIVAIAPVVPLGD